ncbi:MAG: hypothetical protein PWQ41_7 [Bacillota bacterium]|nr:hypothetical protein [Bacillota bacterium]MDK2854920.1 hypothetical protein [Bacillota bacterium]MDK2924233.1 hypothetical protein [Bacillota bacterium]
MPEPMKRIPRYYPLAALVLALLFSLSFGTALALKSLLAPDRIVPGVRVEGIDLSHLTAEEAERLLAPRAEAIEGTVLFLQARERTYTVKAKDIGIGADVKLTVKNALAVGHRGNLLEMLRERYKIKQTGYTLPLELSLDTRKLQGYLAQLAQEINVPPRDAYLTLNEKNEAEPVAGKAGRALDVAESEERIVAAVRRGGGYVALVVKEIPPKRTVEDLWRLGIRDVVALYTTRFKASDRDRTYNLKLGAEALNGHVVAPDEVFSFNEVVGPREARQGYREAPVIIKNELVPGIGGGICQVSSTLYNAVLLAGMDPVERSNHSLPSAYVGLGRDATVAYGSIDFKFKNTRPEPVMLGSRVHGNELTIAIFGTPREEKVEINTTVEEEIPFPVLFKEDPTLKPGEDKLKQEGRPGYKVVVRRRIWRAGRLVRDEILSRDTYQPQPEVHLVGAVPGPEVPFSPARVSPQPKASR